MRTAESRAGPAAPGARRGGAVARRGWGWSAGAEDELRSSSGECLAAGSRGRERPNVDFCLGATCQQKRRLKTRAGAIYRHPRRRGRGAALASHCSICSAHPTQAEFGITLTMWEIFFSASLSLTPRLPPPRTRLNSEILNNTPLLNPEDGSALTGRPWGRETDVQWPSELKGHTSALCVTIASSTNWKMEEKVERRVAWLTIFLYRLTHSQCLRCFLKCHF